MSKPNSRRSKIATLIAVATAPTAPTAPVPPASSEAPAVPPKIPVVDRSKRSKDADEWVPPPGWTQPRGLTPTLYAMIMDPANHIEGIDYEHPERLSHDQAVNALQWLADHQKLAPGKGPEANKQYHEMFKKMMGIASHQSGPGLPGSSGSPGATNPMQGGKPLDANGINLYVQQFIRQNQPRALNGAALIAIGQAMINAGKKQTATEKVNPPTPATPAAPAALPSTPTATLPVNPATPVS